MALWELYSGHIGVADDDYMELVSEDGGPPEEMPIEGLDDVLTELTPVAVVLDHPFDRPHRARLSGDDGITLRQVIDAVRQGFRTMYQSRGAYGEVFHPITDIVIETIILDDEKKTISLEVGT